ncbi:MAG: SCO family protein [Dehalococcoidia bacterium]
MRHRTLATATWCVVALLLALLVTGCGADDAAAGDREATPAPLHGTLIDPAATMPGFELVGTDGEPLRSDDYRGRFVAVYFGYTHCPDVCPLTLGVLKQAVAELTPEEQTQFAVLMIAVDPERDTPEVLDRYMALFHPDFEAATGEPERVETVLTSWGVQVTREPVGEWGYNVSHPASVYLLDPEGRWVLAFDHSHSADDIASDLRQLMAAEADRQATAIPPTRTAPVAGDSAPSRPLRWFFALGNGSVVLREADGSERVILQPWSIEPSEDDLARRQYPGARELAYDATTGVLWFADTHEAIHSINVDTGERGPSIDGFADAALPGCGVADLSREFALLPGGHLVVPTLLGTTVVYDTADGTMVEALSPTAFGVPLLSLFRPFAASTDGTSAWYVDATGWLHRFTPTDWYLLEDAIAPLPGAPATALVEIAVAPDGSAVYYLTEDGELRAWDIAGDRPGDPLPAPPPNTRSIAVG